jgi:hypothetical protein
VIYYRDVARVWHGVAATLLGPRAMEGGTRTAAIGVLMHFGVAFAWSAVFLLVLEGSAWLRGVVHSPGGVLKVAAVYGPFIWLVMSLGVIPLLTHRPPNIAWRWWLQLAGHIPFVGVPLVWGIRRDTPPRLSPPPMAHVRAVYDRYFRESVHRAGSPHIWPTE